MDALKKRIANQVKEQVRMLDSTNLAEDGGFLEVVSVDALQSQIRVRQRNNPAPRYFLVKVSEQL